MYGYIYITHNKINGKIYIGQRKGAYDKKYFGSGLAICRAIKRYGVENFENHIIEWCNSKDTLNKREIYWIAKYNCNTINDYGYNIAPGGQGGHICDQSGKNNGMYGKKHSCETLNKMSNSLSGKNNPRSRESVIIYKNNEYKFVNRAEAIKYFKSNFNIDVYCLFRYGGLPKKMIMHLKDFQLVKIGEEVKYAD